MFYKIVIFKLDTVHKSAENKFKKQNIRVTDRRTDGQTYLQMSRPQSPDRNLAVLRVQTERLNVTELFEYSIILSIYGQTDRLVDG